ncbi:MAG: DUF2959 domain-containing protein [Chloroflexota bacterium]
MKTISLEHIFMIAMLTAVLYIAGCSKAYYGVMEKVGIHKRDILVDRVEDARDAQSEAQEQFKDALEQFGAVVKIESTDLKEAYETLNAEYEASEKAAENVSRRIDKVESVAEDLFAEWEKELQLYKNKALQRSSAQKLRQTRSRYQEMLDSMRKAEKSMTPVLDSFQDNVLFLKHNLNAQAIGSLRAEFSNLEQGIDSLIKRMNDAIYRSNKFIDELQQ